MSNMNNDTVTLTSSVTTMMLCEGRHDIPQAIDGAIFPNTLNPLDLAKMGKIVDNKLKGVQNLHLYVTGLTAALVEVINYCHINNIDLTLYHYDVESNDYYPQLVL